MFAILLLDVNSLSSARHAPKKWNINYISVHGLSETEQSIWDQQYGENWTSTDSELTKELTIVSQMLNALADFGYSVVSSCVSQPRVAHKENENNRECFVWTLQKQRSCNVDWLSCKTVETPLLPRARVQEDSECSIYDSAQELAPERKTEDVSVQTDCTEQSLIVYPPNHNLDAVVTENVIIADVLPEEASPELNVCANVASDNGDCSSSLDFTYSDTVSNESLASSVESSTIFSRQRLVINSQDSIRFNCAAIDAAVFSDSSDV